MNIVDYGGGTNSTAISVKGLGRDWAWQDFVEADKNHTALCALFPEHNMPYGCYDGG